MLLQPDENNQGFLFFPKSMRFSRFSKKDRGGLPLPPNCAPAKYYFEIVLQLVIFLASEEMIVSFLCYKS